MKKYFALIICAILVLGCFTACGTKIQGGEVVTDLANNPVAVVTAEGGAAKRDENGNIIALVTDENGKNVKDENGNYATEAITVNHVLMLGGTAETKYFSLRIPKGWTFNETSFTSLTLNNDKGYGISINSTNGKTASQLLSEMPLLDAVDKNFPDSKKINTSVEFNGENYPFVARYIEKDSKGGQTYLGFIFFDHNGIGFTCMVTGNRDITDDVDDIAAVLNTIQYK